jgi:hypothetical protein
VSIFLSLASDGREAPRMTPEAIEWGNEIVQAQHEATHRPVCKPNMAGNELRGPSFKQMRAWLPEQAKKKREGLRHDERDVNRKLPHLKQDPSGTRSSKKIGRLRVGHGPSLHGARQAWQADLAGFPSKAPYVNLSGPRIMNLAFQSPSRGGARPLTGQ